MASYLVLEPSETGPERTERAMLVRDGFAVLAFLLPLIWFLWHRMWLEALAFLAVALGLGALASLLDPTVLPALLSVLLSVLVGLEARALRVAALRRRGWREWGVVEGANRQEAELRYAAEVEGAAPQRPAAAPPAVPAAPRAGPAGQKSPGPAFGLIDYPRKS